MSGIEALHTGLKTYVDRTGAKQSEFQRELGEVRRQLDAGSGRLRERNRWRIKTGGVFRLRVEPPCLPIQPFRSLGTRADEGLGIPAVHLVSQTNQNLVGPLDRD